MAHPEFWVNVYETGTKRLPLSRRTKHYRREAAVIAVWRLPAFCVYRVHVIPKEQPRG